MSLIENADLVNLACWPRLEVIKQSQTSLYLRISIPYFIIYLPLKGCYNIGETLLMMLLV